MVQKENEILKQQIELFSMPKWDLELTQMWLSQLTLPVMSEERLAIFLEHNIEGRHLARLEDHHLKEMGFVKIGDRLDLMYAINEASMSWERYRSRTSITNLLVRKGDGISLGDAQSLLHMIIEHFTTLPYEEFLIHTSLDFIYGNNFFAKGWPGADQKNKAGGFSFNLPKLTPDDQDAPSFTIGTSQMHQFENMKSMSERDNRSRKILKFACITASDHFGQKSLEELRLEDEIGVRAAPPKHLSLTENHTEEKTLPVAIDMTKEPELFKSKPKSRTQRGFFPNHTTGGLFASSSNQTNSGGLFGTGSNQTNSGGLFGTGRPSSGGGLFGGHNSGGGLFGSNQQNSTPSGGLFGANEKSGGLFSGSASDAGTMRKSNCSTAVKNSNGGFSLFSDSSKKGGSGLFSSSTSDADKTSGTNQSDGGLLSGGTSDSDNISTNISDRGFFGGGRTTSTDAQKAFGEFKSFLANRDKTKADEDAESDSKGSIRDGDQHMAKNSTPDEKVIRDKVLDYKQKKRKSKRKTTDSLGSTTESDKGLFGGSITSSTDAQKVFGEFNLFSRDRPTIQEYLSGDKADNREESDQAKNSAPDTSASSERSDDPGLFGAKRDPASDKSSLETKKQSPEAHNDATDEKGAEKTDSTGGGS